MAVPKRRTSKSRKGMRRSHHSLTPKQLQYCGNPACEQPILPHRICAKCGWYQNREVEKPEATKAEGK